jgi:hypothetical protein
LSLSIIKYDSRLTEDEMGGICGTYWGEERFVQGFGGELEGKRPLGECR